MNSGAADRDDVWRLDGSAGPIEQFWIVVWDEHAGNQDSEDIEYDNPPEHATNGLCDVSARVLRLRRSASWIRSVIYR